MLGTLSFIQDTDKWNKEKPYDIIGFPESEVPIHQRTNIVYEIIETVEVRDLRAQDKKTSFNEHGFEWQTHHSEFLVDSGPFTAKEENNPVVRGYLEETSELAKKIIGAHSAYVYDWRFRRNGTIYRNGQPDTNPGTSRSFVYAPISNVHADYSPQGGIDRIRLHLSNEENRNVQASGSRIILVNAWRPFKTVENTPLAVCDRRSIRAADVVLVDKVMPNNVEEETSIRYSPNQRWYYLSRQTPEEILFFIQWEDAGSSRENMSVPHAALSGAETNIGITPRESLEVRLLVIV